MSRWLDDLPPCAECGMRRVVTISMAVDIDGLECRTCLSCGKTCWERDGTPASWDDVRRAARAMWAIPSPRRRRDLAHSAA